MKLELSVLLATLCQVIVAQFQPPIALPFVRPVRLPGGKQRGPPPKARLFLNHRPDQGRPLPNQNRGGAPADKQLRMGKSLQGRTGFPTGRTGGNPPPSLNQIRVDIPALVAEAVQKVHSEDAQMQTRLQQGIDMPATSFHSMDPIMFSESPLNAFDISRQSRLINWIGRLLRHKGSGISVSTVLAHPEAIRQGIQCPYKPPACNFNTKYRTFDGSCNNVRNPLWGSAFTPYKRELRAEYRIDIPKKRDDLPRTHVRGNVELRSPRDISLIVHQAPHTADKDSIWNMEFSLWGQFLSHDLTDKAPNKGFNGSMLRCCEQRIPTPDEICVNMNTKPGDLFRNFQRSCLDLSRSLEATSLTCREGRREQLNQATSFIDGSAIYGINEERARHLRSGIGGRLAVSEPNELPIMPHPNVQATLHGFAYFGSGDDRANVYAGLIAIETVWMREHNRIADQLSRLNPHWNDEKTFQETRRIIIAMVQHITYTDYIRGTVGDDNWLLFGLSPTRNGYFNGYNSSADPSLSNAFAASALRFGHSMIRDSFTKRDRSYRNDGSPALNLKDMFFRSSVFLKEEDSLMRGFVHDAVPVCDRILTDGLANHLHQTKAGNGADLAAINIQRNRDHAIPSYNAYRRLYGLSVATRWDTSDFGFKDQTQETVNLFRQVYSHPDDVELWTAGLSEIPLDDTTAVGPLFAKMMAQQFQLLKNGDRFYYETGDINIRFTLAQLDEIRKIRFSKVLCNNMIFDTIQPNVFLVDTHRNNGKVPCSTLQDINLIHWRE